HHVQGADQRVADATPFFADGPRQLGEEGPGEAGRALADDQPEHGDERDERRDEADGAHHRHAPVHDLPVGERGVEVHAWTLLGPRWTAVTSTRAAALRRKVVAKRMRPSPASAPMCTLLVASANSLAMTAGRL